MESEDKRINQLTQISNAPANGVLPIDVPGNAETNGITVANLLQGCFSIKSTFEGDVNNLRVPGMYYTTGNTQNSINTGLFIVFTSGEAVCQFSVNVFNGLAYFRSLMYNNNNWDKWTDWKQTSFT